MKVALAQMVSGEVFEANLQFIESSIHQAAAAKADLVIFPENCLLSDSSQLHRLAYQIMSSELLDQVARWARNLGIGIVLGSLPCIHQHSHEVGAGRVRSTSLFWNKQGQLIAQYEKIHLFDASVADGQGEYAESSYIAPGNQVVTAEFEGFCIGLSICYDLRFPDIYQVLREKGAEILLVPSAFTKVTGEAHWCPLLRARAIETQCYVLGVNQGGFHSKRRETYGHTMAIDPWGRVIDSLTTGEGLLFVDLHKSIINKVRQEMPVFSHRRIRRTSP